MEEPRVGPVAVIGSISIARIGDDQPQRTDPGDIDGGNGNRRAGRSHHRTGIDGCAAAIEIDFEDDGAASDDFIIHTDVGVEFGVISADEIEGNVGIGVNTQTFLVLHAVERDGVTVTGGVFAVAGILLVRPPAVGGGGRSETAHIDRRRWWRW